MSLRRSLGILSTATKINPHPTVETDITVKNCLYSQVEIEIKFPRDRDAEFKSQLVKKHQTDISSLEDKIIFQYSQGTSPRDIEKIMRDMYGIEVDDTRVSKMKE